MTSLHSVRFHNSRSENSCLRHTTDLIVGVLAGTPSPPGEWPEISNRRTGDQIEGRIRHAKRMVEHWRRLWERIVLLRS